VVAFLVGSFEHWTIWGVLVHPLRPGNPVDGWGGILSSLSEYTIAVSVVVGVVAAYRKHECHIDKCHWLAWHPDQTGHPVCRGHHPEGRHHPALAARPRWTQNPGIVEAQLSPSAPRPEPAP
jgi:hypothetical protein